MNLKELIENFCMEHDAYAFESDYCGATVDAAHCIGVSLSVEDSYMNMLFELTEYLDQHNFDDDNLELSNPAIDELSDRVVVYFPHIQGRSFCHGQRPLV